jgi:2-polyprenyl-3-methyl-5-hydroxy-6-metoxy-1,4-benzoquinol methylase
MTEEVSEEKELWGKVTALMGNGRVVMGRRWSSRIYSDPACLPGVLSRYKFTARLATRGKRVLELGCGEGVGSRLLAEFAQSYIGIDADEEAVATARRNLTDAKYTFLAGNFLGRCLGAYDTVVSLDLLQHLDPAEEPVFFDTCHANLGADGVCVVGLPNPAPASPDIPLNRFDDGRLKTTLQRYFHNVFLFGLNEELVHTGLLSRADFLIAVGVYKRGDVLQ